MIMKNLLHNDKQCDIAMGSDAHSAIKLYQPLNPKLSRTMSSDMAMAFLLTKVNVCVIKYKRRKYFRYNQFNAQRLY